MVERRKWTTEEDDVLRREYRRLFRNLEELKRLLPGRSRDAIVIRANRLGVCGMNWTSDEDRAIKLCYSDYGAGYVRVTYMPYRTEVAIQCRANKLGVKRSRQTLDRPQGDILRAYDIAFHKRWRKDK
jgi:hypothetical protein